jgi:hypothetical protein
MEHDELSRSRERVRMMAEIVSIQIDEDRLDALATSLDAALVMLQGIDGLVVDENLPVAAPYDAAWREGDAPR